MLEIKHYFRGCHVFSKNEQPVVNVRLRKGDRIQLVDHDPMDFDVTQTAGRRVGLADPRLRRSEVRLLVFRKAGLYRFELKNVQTSEEPRATNARPGQHAEDRRPGSVGACLSAGRAPCFATAWPSSPRGSPSSVSARGRRRSCHHCSPTHSQFRGTDSERARTILRERFDESDDGAFTVVFPGSSAATDAEHAQLERRLADAAKVVPTARAEELRDGGALFADIRTSLSLQEAKTHTDDLRRALRTSSGPVALVTGQPAVQRDLDRIFAADLRRGELIAVVVALVALLLVFGLSAAVVVPFAVAACTIAATVTAVFLVAHGVTMVTYVTNVVALIGFALAVDYSLLMVFRFREEVARGGAVQDAVVRTMATAGRAVVVSGLAVALGLALLIFVPVPLIRSLGIGGLLIPLASIAAALTLQPVLLSLLGARGVGRYLSVRQAPRWSPAAGHGSHEPSWVDRCSFSQRAPCCSSRLLCRCSLSS